MLKMTGRKGVLTMLKLVTYKGTPICGIKHADGKDPLYLVGTINDLIDEELISMDHQPKENRWLCVRVSDKVGKRVSVGYASLIDALRSVEPLEEDVFHWGDVAEKIVKMAFGRFSDYRLV